MKTKTASSARRKTATRSAQNRKTGNLLDERLLKGEKVVQTAEISAGIYWKSVAVLLLALFFALFVFVELGILLAVFAVLLIVHAILKKEILMLVVTNKRILVRYGILQVDVVDIHFDKIESVELERMLTGYVMGYANVVIMGTGGRYIVIPFVANAIAIRKAYNEQVLETEPQPDAASGARSSSESPSA